MKKLIVILSILVAVVALSSCKKEDSFTVHFEGDFMEPFYITVKVGEVAEKPADPVAQGYVFEYWEDERGQKYEFNVPVYKDLHLKAVWKKVEKQRFYSVKFYNSDGFLISTQQVPYGGRAQSPAVKTNEFFSYSWDGNFENVTSDLEIHAIEKYEAADIGLFTYRLKDDKTYSISGISKSGLPTLSSGYVKLALPEYYYGGAPITSIDDGEYLRGVFTGCNIISLYIPSCYERIGNYAFYGNPELNVVDFNEGLREIGEGAFMATFGGKYSVKGNPVYVSSLTNIKLPSSLEVVGAHAFDHVGGRIAGSYVSEEVELSFASPSKLRQIGESAFEGVMLRNIVLPETTEALTICDKAFKADTYLNYIYTGNDGYPRSSTELIRLPSSVSYIGDFAFYGAGNNYKYMGGGFVNAAKRVNLINGSFKLDHVGDYAFGYVALYGELKLEVSAIGEFCFYGQMFTSIDLIGVREIGKEAFARSQGEMLVKVKLGEELTSIGERAFMNNRGLNEITLPDPLISIGEGAFWGCASLGGDLELPSSLEFIGRYAFNGCRLGRVTSASEVELDDFAFAGSGLSAFAGEISSVGEGTFENNVLLTSVTLPKMITALPDRLFASCTRLGRVEIPDPVVEIGDEAFYNCAYIDSIIMPTSLNTIGDEAFSGCSRLNSITFKGDGLTVIGNMAFAYCEALSKIDLPGSVQEIGDLAFMNSGLTSFVTPASLKKMGAKVFYADYTGNSGKPRIEEFTVSASTGEIQFSEKGTFDGSLVKRFSVEEGNLFYSAENGILYDKDKTKLIMYVIDEDMSVINFADGLLEIADCTFYGNRFITEVIFPSSLERVGDYAFYNCRQLKRVFFAGCPNYIGKFAFAGSSETPGALENLTFSSGNELVIDNNAFYLNINLTHLKLPSSLVSIGDKAFSDNASLAFLDLSEATKLTHIGDRAFAGTTTKLSPEITNLNFNGCVSLESTGRNAFMNCDMLAEINFGTLKRIDQGAFGGCTALKDLNIGSSIETIEANAFRSCTALRNINLPEINVLSSIGEYAFAGKSSDKMRLEKVDLSAATALTEIKDFAFAYGNLNEVILPDSEFTLCDEAFASCSSLKTIDLGGAVSIGRNVFRYCIALKTIAIPSTVKVIGDEAFRELNLSRVEIGDRVNGNSVEYFGKYAFFGCKSLDDVYIYGDRVPSLSAADDTMPFHCLDDSGNIAIIARLRIFVSRNMKSSFVSPIGDEKSGWEVYSDIIYETE